jgi:hypothetical protein
MAVKAIAYTRDPALDNDGLLLIQVNMSIANGNPGGFTYGPVAPGTTAATMLPAILAAVRTEAENMGQTFGPLDTVRLFYSEDLTS